MANLEIRVDMVEPYADGRAFGKIGPYLRISVSSKASSIRRRPRTRVIVDLDKAPRKMPGLVAYETDFFIMHPADSARTNGVPVRDATNRGAKRIFHPLDRAPGDSPPPRPIRRPLKRPDSGF
jgi:hypothetical protein